VGKSRKFRKVRKMLAPKALSTQQRLLRAAELAKRVYAKVEARGLTEEQLRADIKKAREDVRSRRPYRT